MEIFLGTPLVLIMHFPGLLTELDKLYQNLGTPGSSACYSGRTAQLYAKKKKTYSKATEKLGRSFCLREESGETYVRVMAIGEKLDTHTFRKEDPNRKSLEYLCMMAARSGCSYLESVRTEKIKSAEVPSAHHVEYPKRIMLRNPHGPPLHATLCQKCFTSLQRKELPPTDQNSFTHSSAVTKSIFCSL
jgi:hypothetical protein